MPRARSAALLLALLVCPTGPAAAQSSPSHPRVGTSVTVNELMSYDSAAKTVRIELIAAYGNANGGMNFNGGSKGHPSIIVPQGWWVIIHFVNRDAVPHSAIILRERLPLPAAPEEPAIPRAYTVDVTAGLPTGGSDRMEFTAARAGRYFIVCGVPGHGPSGMYIGFVVSARAKVPSYRR
jgi:sulfocyanin